MTANASILTLDTKNMKPFDPRVYSPQISRDSKLFDIPLAVDKGFPQVSRIIPWIPGVSTPEGAILSVSLPIIILNTVANGGEAALRALEGAASAIFALVIIGIPTSMTWLSTQVLYPKR